ncbi:MAG: hypothetical protein KU29_07465 [Sulfurovum sp. FS06-10]|nr:MAG: hypothetical protein KU29_07465 [Sulfurovum sp. FS06-10]
MVRNPLIVSKKFTGVYHKVLLDGDVSFCINYKENGKVKWVTIGKKSEGINEAFCHQQRIDIINKSKFGEQAPIIKNKAKKKSSLFDDMAKEYIDNQDLKPRTAYLYKNYLNYLSSFIGDKSLSEIDADEVKKIKATLKKNEKSNATINAHIAFIRAVFNYATKNEKHKGVSPCENVDLLSIDNNRERYLSVDEVKQLKQAVKSDAMLSLFIELSLSTGGRVETILSIAKKDINFIQRTITLTNHKAKRTYTGFISDSLLALLQKRCNAIKDPNELIIKLHSKSKDKPFQAMSIRIKNIMNELFNSGLSSRDAKNRVVIHTIRHTFASHLAINGTPIFTIMKLLDHSDIKHTLRYAKLAEDSGLTHIKGLF